MPRIILQRLFLKVIQFPTIPNLSRDRAIAKCDLEKFKVKVMGEVEGQCHIWVVPISKRCTSFSCQLDQPFLRYGWYSVWPWKSTSEILKKIAIKVFNRIAQKVNQVISNTRSCCDWVSSFHFIVHTSKFLFIIATAVTLRRGHGKVTQYIPKTYTFFVPNI